MVFSGRKIMGGQRRYTLKEDYFNVINTEQKAYFLGLLYADGYNAEDKNYISISLVEKDVDIVEKLRDVLSSDRPLYTIDFHDQNSQPQKKLHINSKKLSQQLSKLGCKQRKTFTLKFPTEKQVPILLIRHFIRGYFDGDGSMSRYKVAKETSDKFIVCIVSTEKYCLKLSKILKKQLKINCYLNTRFPERDNTTRQLFISGRKQVVKFLSWIYDNSSIYLDRKYKHYIEEFKNSEPQPITGCKGVSFNSRWNKWVAVIYHKNKKYALGGFKTFEEAQKVVISKRQELGIL